MKKITVILADDHAILRYGIRSFLATADDIRVIGEASTGDECLQLFHEKKPDVSLIDIGMPGKNGLEVIEAIRATNKKAKIIILSMHSDEHMLRKALQAGIDGYLSKNTSKKKILEAIRTVAGGDTVFSDSVLELRENDLDNGDSREYAAEKKLTSREMDVLKLVVAGYSSPEIAEKLFISRRTVDTHRNNMMQKLDIHNTASLVRYALENGLIDKS